MSYKVLARTPKGAAKTYGVYDNDTGELKQEISARQYRNRTEAAKSGFTTISEKQRVESTFDVQNFPRVGTQHHHYKLGVPDNLEAAINSIVRKEQKANYGYSMTLSGRYRIYGDEGIFYRTVQSRVRKLGTDGIQAMIDDMKSHAMNYGEIVQLVGVWLDIIAIRKVK